MPEKYECELMGWDEFGVLAENLADMIKVDYGPEVIIGLARGGWVPARVLCDHLGVKNLASLRVEHWGVTATPDKFAKIKGGLNIGVKGKKVLIVDDLADTGESMELAFNYVKGMGPAQIKTAVLISIKGSKFTPDYYVKEIGWKWVVFPWNVFEDMKNIIPKVLDGNDSVTDIKSKLKKNFNIGVDEKIIEKILAGQ